MAIRKRGRRTVDTMTFDMPIPLGELIDAEMERRNGDPPHRWGRGDVVVSILANDLGFAMPYKEVAGEHEDTTGPGS